MCKLCLRLHWTVVSHSKLPEILNQLAVGLESLRGLESRRCERPSTAISPRQWLTRAQARPIQVRCPSKSNMQFIVSGHGISKAGFQMLKNKLHIEGEVHYFEHLGLLRGLIPCFWNVKRLLHISTFQKQGIRLVNRPYVQNGNIHTSYYLHRVKGCFCTRLFCLLYKGLSW